MIRKSRRTTFISLSLLLLFAVLLSACSQNNAAKSDGDHLAMAPMAGMPSAVKSAPTTVQQSYQFAVANPDVLNKIPCYCGCGTIGHTSNYACYVQGAGDKGTITFDEHALGCSICVDITQDTMRLMRQGQSPSAIKVFIDQTYSQYGPSNMP